MRRFVSTGLALGALIAPAGAADMPAYNKAPTTVFSWTGFYLGGDIAVAATTNNAEWSPLSTWGTPFGVQQVGGGTGGASLAGGGLAGYNWQFANAWVAGIEADWTGMKTGGALTETWLANAGGVLPTGFTTLSSELEWTSFNPRSARLSCCAELVGLWHRRCRVGQFPIPRQCRQQRERLRDRGRALRHRDRLGRGRRLRVGALHGLRSAVES